MSTIGSNSDRSTSSSGSDSLARVEFECLKTSNRTNITTLVSIVRFLVAEAPRSLRQVSCDTVVVTSSQGQTTLAINALFKHQRLSQSYVIIITSSTSNRYNQGSLKRHNVTNRSVQIRSKTLVSRLTQSTFVQLVTKLKSIQVPSYVFLIAKSRRDFQLSCIHGSYGRTNGSILAVHDVGHRSIDGVAGALHQFAFGSVFRYVLGDHEGIIKAHQDVIKRYSFFFSKAISHCIIPFLC